MENRGLLSIESQLHTYIVLLDGGWDWGGEGTSIDMRQIELDIHITNPLPTLFEDQSVGGGDLVITPSCINLQKISLVGNQIGEK